MSDQGRILSPDNINTIATRLKDSRNKLKLAVTDVIVDTDKFKDSIADALGDISIEEAKQGLIDFFSDKIRRIRL